MKNPFKKDQEVKDRHARSAIEDLAVMVDAEVMYFDTMYPRVYSLPSAIEKSMEISVNRIRVIELIEKVDALADHLGVEFEREPSVPEKLVAKKKKKGGNDAK